MYATHPCPQLCRAANTPNTTRCGDRRWALLPDGYTFDLQARPPTRALDLLTGYLEVRYADVLLRQDAVRSMQRALSLQQLQDSSRQNGAGGVSTEVLEQPPAALAAPATLSAAERAAVTDTLDGLLGGKQYERYRQAALQLYTDGLISWGACRVCVCLCVSVCLCVCVVCGRLVAGSCCAAAVGVCARSRVCGALVCASAGGTSAAEPPCWLWLACRAARHTACTGGWREGLT
jgi:hypothetical protein